MKIVAVALAFAFGAFASVPFRAQAGFFEAELGMDLEKLFDRAGR